MWKQRTVIRYVRVNLFGTESQFGVTSVFQTVHSVISTLAPDMCGSISQSRLAIVGDDKELSINNTLDDVVNLSIQFYKVRAVFHCGVPKRWKREKCNVIHPYLFAGGKRRPSTCQQTAAAVLEVFKGYFYCNNMLSSTQLSLYRQL